MNKGGYKACEKLPSGGDAITLAVKAYLTNGTKLYVNTFQWWVHSADNVHEKINSGSIIGTEIFQYAPDYETMCVGEKRKVTLQPKKGTKLDFVEFDMKVDVGSVNEVELLHHGHKDSTE